MGQTVDKAFIVAHITKHYEEQTAPMMAEICGCTLTNMNKICNEMGLKPVNVKEWKRNYVLNNYKTMKMGAMILEIDISVAYFEKLCRELGIHKVIDRSDINNNRDRRIRDVKKLLKKSEPAVEKPAPVKKRDKWISPREVFKRLHANNFYNRINEDTILDNPYDKKDDL